MYLSQKGRSPQIAKNAGRNRLNQERIAPLIPSITAPINTEKLNIGPGSAETIEKPIVKL